MEGDSVFVAYPVFSWQPVVLTNRTVVYTIRLVEQLEFQTAAVALQSNPVWVERELGNITTWVYPVDAPGLVADKTYAWQILVNYSGGIDQTGGILISEPASFRRKDIEVEENDDTGIPKLKEEDRWTFHYSNPALGNNLHQSHTYENHLFICYNHRHSDSLLRYVISDRQGKVVVSSETPGTSPILRIPVKVHKGMNYLAIDLTPAALVDGAFYTFQVTDRSGIRHQLEFSHWATTSAKHKQLKSDLKKARRKLNKAN